MFAADQIGARDDDQTGAFEVFERATLVNVERNYDVNHEALIRGWKKYTSWLENNRRLSDRLKHVDQEIR